MEGRKEAFRMYLEQSGTTTALTKCFIKLYELKDERPQTREEALKYMKATLSDNFPSQEDYNELLKEVEESRTKVAAIREAEEAAKEKAAEERQSKADEKKKATKMPDKQKPNQICASQTTITANKNDTASIAGLPAPKFKVKTVDDAVSCLEELQKLPDCTSLLVKHLKVDELRKQPDVTSTDKSLLDCIRLGLEDHNLAMGIYAANKGAYTQFKSIFDPILEEYYGTQSIDLTQLQSHWGDVANENDLCDIKDLNVVHTRITYAVSMEDYELIPAMKMEDLKNLKDSVEKVFKTTQANAKFHEFPISDDIKKNLTDKQLCFDPANKRLEAAGTTDFETGRAIYQSDAEDLTIWINEEEHLKIISTSANGDIKTTFLRLKAGVEAVTSQKLQTTTFCPTNLGPSIHALVVVKLPKLSAAKRDVKKIAEELPLKICVKQSTDQFEITNKPQWNVTQFEAIKEFNNEVKKLLEIEENLITTIVDAKNRLLTLKNDKKDRSLLVQCLSDDIIDKLKDATTKKGTTFIEWITPGLENPDLPVGIYATDTDAYVTFEDIFKPIITAYHDGNDVAYAEDWSLDDSKIQDLNDGPDTSAHLIKSTRITCSRSLSDSPLSPAMEEKDFMDVMDKVKVVLSALSGDLEGTFFDLENMDAKELEAKQQLFGLNNKQLKDIGATKFWPKGRGVFVCNHEKLVIWVNEEDHLKFIATEDGYKIKETFERLKQAVDEVKSKMDFAFHGTWGWVTSCPTKIGSTINASVIMDLPKLASGLAQNSDSIKEIINAHKLEICVERQSDQSNQFEISNNQISNLSSEQAAVLQMQDGAARLKEEENKI